MCWYVQVGVSSIDCVEKVSKMPQKKIHRKTTTSVLMPFSRQDRSDNFWLFVDTSFLIFGILSFKLKSCQISFHRFFPWVPWTPFFPFPQTSSPRLQVFGNWCLDGWHDQTNINSYVIKYPRSWYRHSLFLWNHHPRRQNVLPRISYWWYDALPYAASNFRQQ